MTITIFNEHYNICDLCNEVIKHDISRCDPNCDFCQENINDPHEVKENLK